jgi:FkbM family methyltransferase
VSVVTRYSPRWLDRARAVFRHPDVRHNPLNALLRRLIWHLRWRVKPSTPWVLRLPNDLELEVPRRLGTGALIYYQGTSEPQIALFLRRFLRRGMTFYDIGAHLGEYTIMAAQVVGRQGHVHAFEPNPELFRALSSSVRRNGFSQCTVNRLAVGNANGEVTLNVTGDPALGWISMSAHDESAGQAETEVAPTFEVPMATLDTYWRRSGSGPVDLVKMDIEGAELLALGGATELLSQRSSPVLVFECLPNLLGRFGHTYKDITNRLEILGYVICELTNDGFNSEEVSSGIQLVSGKPAQPNLIATRDPNALALQLAGEMTTRRGGDAQPVGQAATMRTL